MSALAIALKEAGHTITGSDAGFYPPVSDHLKKNKIKFYPGWHIDKMLSQGVIDLVIVGNVASSNNPEWLFVERNKIKYKSYPEVVREFFIKDKSIVVAGTYGKTTITTLLSFILVQAGLNPSYMFGGISDDLPPAKIGDGGWSVVEGDEYKTSRWDEKAKFYHYKPTHLLLTSIYWDHADVYSTSESYTQAFQDLIDMVPDSGTRILSERLKGVLDYKNKKIITYGKNPNNHYSYSDPLLSRDGVVFTIHHQDKKYQIDTKMLGEHSADNITACFSMAYEIGIEPDLIVQSIEKFNGIKRRLEKKLTGDITVLDDIAHSPDKVRSILKTLRAIYDGDIIAIFEPNTGNRTTSAIPQYESAFNDADEVIIPKLTKLKTNPNEKDNFIDGIELAEIIKRDNKNTSYFEDDETLLIHLTHNRKKGDVIVFMGSHSFRGMIDATVERLTPDQNTKR